jgi:hypothetical protein
VVVLVLGLGADAAASRILAATAHAHGTQERRATEERLKIWEGGRGDGMALTHELRKRIGKLLDQIVFWDENIYTPPSITYSGVNFLEYACLSIGTDHTNTVHLLVYCLP